MFDKWHYRSYSTCRFFDFLKHMNTTSPAATKVQVDFDTLMKRLLGLLSKKEKDVIERRFAIGHTNRETLDRIGKRYSVTRERIRQIESVAIQKLIRISQDKSIRVLHDLAQQTLADHGGAMFEDLLISEMLKHIDEPSKVDINSLKFTLKVSRSVQKQEKNQFHRTFWHTQETTAAVVKAAMKDVKKFLSQQKTVQSFEKINEALQDKHPEALLRSAMHIDWNLMEVETGAWGLKSWRFINPRSIKDCIQIVLKNNEKPMHFSDIMQAITADFPDRKKVTPQASHNELIRHDEFVLVGRGLYGLREWGLAAGTVCDLIRSVLIENGGSMKRQDIIQKVLDKRDVRLGTISLSLQKYPFFKRVGRAIYEYDESLDANRRQKYSN